MRRIPVVFIAIAVSAMATAGDLGDSLAPSADHPAIGYFNYLDHSTRDVVSQLSRRIEQGVVDLKFENGNGYLRSVLELLRVPVESQIAVFSKTSLQAPLIEAKNPRTIFFSDSVSVAWMRGGFVELASQDPEQGVVFYTLQQRQTSKPQFQRTDRCTVCHISDASLGIPGMMVRSRFTAPDGMLRLILGGFTTDQRSPFDERWGGYYVTGNPGDIRHLGNTVFVDDDHAETIPVTIGDGYLSPYSDIAALLVFDHQMHMSNLLTRIGWEARAGAYDKRGDLAAVLRDGAAEFVDHLLFVEETPLPGKVRSTSGFPERFAALGPFDSRGRSLRQLDLDKRLMRYPCSYMIYTEAFDSLPVPAKDAIYKRMWRVLRRRKRFEICSALFCRAASHCRNLAGDQKGIARILRTRQEKTNSSAIN